MDRLAFCLKLAAGIFLGKQLNNERWTRAGMPAAFQQFISRWNPRTFVNGTLRGVDVDLNVDGRIRKFRFIEQNPNKTDGKGALKSYAQQARNGSQIVWLIDQDANKFLGRVQDGTWYPSEDRAYSTANARPGAAEPVTPYQWEENVQDVPETIDVPEYVQDYADMDDSILRAMASAEE